MEKSFSCGKPLVILFDGMKDLLREDFPLRLIVYTWGIW